MKFNHPMLPEFLESIVLKRLSVGQGEIDVQVSRVAGEVAVSVVRSFGEVRSVVTS